LKNFFQPLPGDPSLHFVPSRHAESIWRRGLVGEERAKFPFLQIFDAIQSAENAQRLVSGDGVASVAENGEVVFRIRGAKSPASLMET
jgi:hypothetical protein